MSIGNPSRASTVSAWYLDDVLASFIIANGVVTYGKKVTMSFTFWVLNVIKRPEKVSVAKRGMGSKMIQAVERWPIADRDCPGAKMGIN